MRHRIGGIGTNFRIGLGNPDPAKLDNIWPEGCNKILLNKFFKDALKQFFDEYGYVDFSIGQDFVSVGVEPSYAYERLRIITLQREKEKSSFIDGYAFGGYGTEIVKKSKKYSDYKRKTPFIQFIDKWHNLLFP